MRKLSPVAPGAKVTWLELFYDLVFAYAFINVTLAASTGLDDVLRALLLVAVLWYLWVTFVTLDNIMRGDEGLLPFATLVGVGATFVAAVVIPDAYGNRPRGADFIFAGCYSVVRLVQVAAIWQRVRTDPRLRPRWFGLVSPPIVNMALLLTAATLPHFVAGHTFLIHAGLLGLAIVVAYGASAFLGFQELERIAVRHWADRYGQIILIALGEPIISMGSALHLSNGAPAKLPVVGTVALGVAIITAMAFAYFDTRMPAAEHALRLAQGRSQVALARDAYIFLHLPMIIGILLFSLGLRNVLSSVADPAASLTVAAGLVNTSLLYGGLFVYLMALMGFQLRTGQTARVIEVGSRLPLLPMIALGLVLPAIVLVAMLAALVVATSILKYLRTGVSRTRLRAVVRAAHRAVEAAEAYEHGREGDHGSDTPGA
ncbi:MAG: low temperature requirement protein A [Micromonosporaceae bacterium]|nr:low temperature requirement protein A [Micromonosporaceae bacterium]